LEKGDDEDDARVLKAEKKKVKAKTKRETKEPSGNEENKNNQKAKKS